MSHLPDLTHMHKTAEVLYAARELLINAITDAATQRGDIKNEMLVLHDRLMPLLWAPYSTYHADTDWDENQKYVIRSMVDACNAVHDKTRLLVNGSTYLKPITNQQLLAFAEMCRLVHIMSDMVRKISFELYWYEQDYKNEPA